MKQGIGVAAQVLALVVFAAGSHAFGVSKEYVQTASQRLDAANQLVGTVTFETSQTSYFPAGQIVADLGGGKKQLKLKHVPGATVEGYQDGPDTSASMVTHGKSLLTLKPGEVVVSNDYGQDRKTVHRFDGKMMSEEVGSKSASGSERKRSRSWPAASFTEPAPVPAVVMELAASHLDGVETKEADGKLTMTESFKGVPVRERVVDASTGRLLSVRLLGEAGKPLEETTFSGSETVKGLPLPTAIRFAWYTPQGDPQRIVDVTAIKYDLK